MKSYTRCLALDPGKTTGAVVLDASSSRDRYIEFSAQIEIEDAAETINELIVEFKPDVLVVERFVISQRTVKYGRQHEALDVIGGVKFLADLHEPPLNVILQAASDAKTAYTDKNLKDLELFTAVKGRHARDALRHALLWTHTLKT